MEQLSLSLLGRFHAKLSDQTLPGFRTKATQALLIYLASQPDDAHNREQLMTLLWPGMPLKSARANLRQTLYQLRQDIPEVKSQSGEALVELITANRQVIKLNPDAAVLTDVIRFESLLNRIAAHDHFDLFLCSDCRTDLALAVELYQGDFLNDFFLEDSNDFEDWAQSRREYYRRRALDALAILTTIDIRRKKYPQAQQTAERQLQIDNLNENAYRQLMEIHALNGRRQQALAAYEKCRRVLAEELGMAPTARTDSIYEKIVAGNLNFHTADQQAVRGYELKEQIGEGAHGAIHRAIQPGIAREVAVKVIRRRYADDPAFIRRFEAEAQIVARLEHPHIVPLYDYWRDPNGAYLVMRYMRHGSLLVALEDGPLNLSQTATLLTQIAAALAAAHQQGVIHRDIKPGNILLDEAGNAYLTDFGIAKDLLGQEPITSEKAVVGTLDYISPEQILSGDITPQSDIYSLGAVIYETLTGEKPFADDSIANLLHNHLNNPMPLVTATRPDIPTEIDVVLQKATAKKAADRYATAPEMAKAFFAAVGGTVIEKGDDTAERFLPEVTEIYNPYKGLRAFQEADADDFFGRDALVQQLVDRLGESSSRFLAIVGPSGSGKSSAVKAGLIPALRNGALPGSENWFTAEMVPGTHPLEELELALWPVAVDPPPSLVEPMQRDTRGMLRTLRRILPEEDGSAPQLLLVIDQFEELFTLVDDPDRREFFLDSLLTALTAPRSPLRVVLTLRADFYDRPLLHQDWGQIIKHNTEIVLPLNHSELTWAIREPARRMGVRLEEELIATIVADVADQLGGLPLLQYALTELFERREGNLITQTAYREIGGVQGALGRRAEAIYDSLDENGREATRQLFLRLVTLGEGSEDTRRRVLRSELTTLLHNSQFIIHYSLLETVLNSFGNARLLTFDRDPTSRTPTVEVAHEALLREWSRLRRWLEQSRDDVRLQRLLALAAGEWLNANKDEGYLLRGSRLDLFGAWSEETQLALTQDEKNFLAASLAARTARQEEEEARRQRELQTARQLAETEKVRADEQAQAAGRLRQRAVWLVGALVIAAVLALAALFFAQQSNQNAQSAQQNADAAATSESQAIAEANQRATAQAGVEEALATADAAALAEAAAAATAQAEAVARGEAEAAAIEERELAEQQAQIATARELAAAALSNLDVDPELSILLALESLKITHTFEAESALHQAIIASPLRHTFYNDTIHSGFVTASPDGQIIYSSGAGGGKAWNPITREPLYTHTVTNESWINLADFSPDGSLLALPNELYDEMGQPLSGTVTIVNAQTGEEIVNFTAHNDPTEVTRFSRDGTLLATEGFDLKVNVWDVEATIATGTGQLVASFCCLDDWGYGLDFSPGNEELAIPMGAGELVIWDIATGERRLTLGPDIYIDARYSPDGQYLVTAGGIGNVDVWDPITGARLSSNIGHSGNALTRVQFSPDGSQLVSTSNVGSITLWRFSPDRLEAIRNFPNQERGVGGAAFSPDGRFLFTSNGISGQTGVVRIWDISPAGSAEIVAIKTHDIRSTRFHLINDGAQLLTVGNDGMLREWDTGSWEEIRAMQVHDGRIEGFDVSPDGQSFATASNDDVTPKIWDAETWALLFTLEGHELQDAGFNRGVFFIRYTPDGQHLATSGADGTVRIWDATNGTLLQTLVHSPGGPGGGWVTRVAYSPDGMLLATAGQDSTIKIWDATNGNHLLTLSNDPPSGAYWGLNFSPDGGRLSAGTLQQITEMWQLPEDPWQATNEDAIQLFRLQFRGGVGGFSPDGERAVVSDNAGLVEIRDAYTGELLLSLQQPGPVASKQFSPDGRFLMTSGWDGIFRIWAIDLDELIALAQSRVTRSLTEAECQQYLHLDACPTEP